MANKNYMAEVAKMLDVKLYESFKIDFCGECTRNDSYHLSHDGVTIETKGYACVSSEILFKLLVGDWKIKRIPWKPSYKEVFYFVAKNGTVLSDVWYEHAFDLMVRKLGNCYRTKEEAELDRDKWIAFYASDEVLEV